MSTTTILTVEELFKVMPGAPAGRAAVLVPYLNDVLQQYGITDRFRLAAFLANVAHETAQLHYMFELWGPTTAQRRYEPPSPLAKRLGNTEEGDGYRFRGRGLLMLTGRYNYTKASEALGVDLTEDPDSVGNDPYRAAVTAAWFWADNGLNSIADSGNFRSVVVAINGGTNGIDLRTSYYTQALEVFA